MVGKKRQSYNPKNMHIEESSASLCSSVDSQDSYHLKRDHPKRQNSKFSRKNIHNSIVGNYLKLVSNSQSQLLPQMKMYQRNALEELVAIQCLKQARNYQIMVKQFNTKKSSVFHENRKSLLK